MPSLTLWFQGNGITYVGNTDYFPSIPFGKPPVGPLRFKPPVPWTTTDSNTTIDATAFEPSCLQGLTDFEGPTSEDCLTLHIYGGGFYFGTAEGYQGWYMANRDVLNVPPGWKGEDQGPVVLGPVLALGDVFLSELPSVSIRAGRFAKVPFINGAVLDEGTIFLNPETPETEKNVTQMALIPGAGPLLWLQQSNYPAASSPYRTGNETFGKAAQYKGLASVASRRDHIRIATRFGVPVWSYLFTATINTLLAPFQPEADFPREGVQHTSEIAFVFRALSQSGLPIPEPYLRLEDSIFNYWLNFVYTLNPSSELVFYMYWPKYGKNATLLELGIDIYQILDTFRAEAIEYITDTPSLYN
ncbi:Carboxylesterase family [Rhizoctonia solani]|uniref:Carboxylesterase family n=1 Tax=Rhizoctonia solani TaxID=456999 RepID=A0A8H8P241_9AGAM|nr:Carboxylesterase family [Rhizoctonia solani]QRW23815.1 Carboxylesterase family [Rhizoctonia solani]